MAISTRTVSNILTRSAPKACAIGDSRFADSAYGVNGEQWNILGPLQWMKWRTGHRVRINFADVFAVAGTTTGGLVNPGSSNSWIGTQLPLAVAGGYDVCFVDGPTNNITGQTSSVNTITDMTAIFDALIAKGILIVANTITPRSGASALTAAAERVRNDYNYWLLQCARNLPGRLIVADACPSVTDFSTSGPLTGMLRDGLHWQPAGAQVQGNLMGDAVNQFFAPSTGFFDNANGVYNATNSIRGNRITNGLLAGTAGTKANGATGSVADSVLGRLGATSTMTCAFSKGTHPTYSTLPTQIMTLGGTGDGAAAELCWGWPSSLIAGDLVELQAEVSWSALTGITAVTMFNGIYLSSGAGFANYIDGSGSQGAGTPLTVAASNIPLRTQYTVPVNLSGGDGSAAIRIQVLSDFGGAAVSGTVTVSRVSVRKVST